LLDGIYLLFNKGIIAARVNEMAPRYRHGANHVFFAFGSDFQFQDAPLPFEALEAVMQHVKSNPAMYNFTLIYSTPEDYFAAIGAPGFTSTAQVEPTVSSADISPAVSAVSASEDWPKFGGDFLPAAFSEHYIRSGRNTSNSQLQACMIYLLTNCAFELQACMIYLLTNCAFELQACMIYLLTNCAFELQECINDIIDYVIMYMNAMQ
jgi:hypothetical protein